MTTGSDIAQIPKRGLEVGDPLLSGKVTHAGRRSGGFFRRMPTLVILVIQALLHGLNYLSVGISSGMLRRHGQADLANYLRAYAGCCALVVMLCCAAFILIARQTRRSLLWGAGCGMAALLVDLGAWVGGFLAGHGRFPILDVLLFWLPLAYVITYAIHEARRLRPTSQTPL
ncbi:MAG TPA: hypothetical protein VI136_17855 [Verrucomicrobiae bacterium]